MTSSATETLSSAAAQVLQSEAQTAVVAFLGSPESYGPAVTSVERIETHGALVFLAGSDVYKIKRAVRFSYMDFSTLDLRRRACAREIEVNQPHAPDIYLGLVAITRNVVGALSIGGSGVPVEWAVHMRRFPSDALLRQVAERGAFGPDLARLTADAIINYHRSAGISTTAAQSRQLARIVSDVSAALRAPSLKFDPSHVGAFDAACQARLAQLGPLLERRAAQGFVRRCHGDLHLANMVLWQGRPTLFDAIEFDEAIATIDTLYDLAFLLMDLDERGQTASANVVLNRYLWRSQARLDLEGLAALPLFLALRAGIRAMVLAQRAAQQPGVAGSKTSDAAQRYMSAALRYLRPGLPRLIAVGGLSGTGKSTLAGRLAPRIGPVPGAVHLRSDLERKSMSGVEDTDRLPAATYTPESSRRVYELLLDKARAALAAGHSTVVDAVYLKEDERRAIEAVAKNLSVQFQGLWLVAPAVTLIDRVNARTGDASDATAEVVRFQAALDPGLSTWAIIDASGGPEETARAALSVLHVD